MALFLLHTNVLRFIRFVGKWIHFYTTFPEVFLTNLCDRRDLLEFIIYRQRQTALAWFCAGIYMGLFLSHKDLIVVPVNLDNLIKIWHYQNTFFKKIFGDDNMEKIKESMSLIKSYLEIAIEKISLDPQVPRLIGKIIGAKRIFLYGFGRSGNVAKDFAMRLKHLKFEVYVVGETTTPALNKVRDLLIIISGSGSDFFEKSVKVAKNVDAEVVLISQNNSSEMRDRVNVFVEIPTKIVKEEELNLAPMGTLFEDIAQIFLDGVVAELIFKLNKTHQDMQKEHSNLEG